MSKRTLILLIVALVTGIVFASHAEPRVVVKQNPMSVNVAATPEVYSSLNFGTPNESHLPTVPDIIISDLLADNVQHLCWIQSSQSNRKIGSFARAGQGFHLTANGGCKPAQQSGQQRLANSELLSGSLCLLSPPGLILRL